ncbi:TonB-dependent receptor [Desulfococcaceae bacterium HSG8]|nr:TonB-dependent receptor [Desulfococcaceae bacterium HSG8]
MKIFIIIMFVLIIFNAVSTFAQETADHEIDQEFKWLQEEAAVVMTAIATKTEMDADLVPGMVTVLLGKDLEDRGVRTVYEALSLVPGLNTYLNSPGDENVSVRGIGGSFFSGNLKLMMDGVALNDSMSAAGYGLYIIPVEQVERIEIIRGPGSVIYGDYAYAGVINVRTRKAGNRIHGSCVWEQWLPYSYGGGGTLTYKVPEKDLTLNLNLFARESDGPDIEAGQDRLYEGFFGMKFGEFSYSPGPTNEVHEDRMMNLSLEYKGFSLSGQYLLNSRGDYFGIIHVLPPEDDRVVVSHEHGALEAGQTLNISDTLKMDIKAGYRRYEFDIDDTIGLPHVMMTLPDGSAIPIAPAEGSVAGPHYEEREVYFGAEMVWRKADRHTILMGTRYSDIEMGDVWVDSNTTDDEYWGVMKRYDGELNWLIEDQKKRIYSAYFQWMSDITDHFTLTGGLRYDHYNDMKESLTPRASAVWRLTDHHILKAQYSEAVRPPSFTELYSRGNSLIQGNPDLDSEHIRSYELGYIYRRPHTTGRITLFYSELRDNIEYPEYANTIGGVGIQYRNAEDIIRTKGFELESEYKIGKTLKLDANLSYSDTDDGETGEPVEGGSDWMGNLGLLYHPVHDVALALQYHYVGNRHRAPDDDRDDADAYNTWNLTANVYNLFTKGLTLRAGVRNLSDEEIVHPAPVFKDEEGNIGYYYRDDFPRPGREWWVQFSYDF